MSSIRPTAKLPTMTLETARKIAAIIASAIRELDECEAGVAAAKYAG